MMRLCSHLTTESTCTCVGCDEWGNTSRRVATEAKVRSQGGQIAGIVFPFLERDGGAASFWKAEMPEHISDQVSFINTAARFMLEGLTACRPS